MSTPTRPAEGAGTSIEPAAARLFLASSRNVPIRLATAALIAVASLPLLRWQWAAAWMCGIGLITLFELDLARSIRKGRQLAVWEGLPVPTLAVTVANGAWYMAFMGCFWLTGDGIARAFAIAQLCISVLYVLLQYYARPKAFLIAASPYLAGAALGSAALGASALREGRPWTILTALVAVGLLCNLFWMARRQLAASRDALRKARIEAQERGVAAEAANAAKSAFLATMSHEIRTPLNGVLGMAQAMSVAPLAPEQRERLEVVRRSGEALLAILNDVLDLAKIEAGRLELEAAPFELAELVDGVREAFSAVAEAKRLAFTCTIEPGAAGAYVGDCNRVRQVLSNLVSNALKFTTTGSVSVNASRHEEVLELSVSDTGVGVPPDRLDQLFEKFTQADASTTRRFGGTGLGLSICRELVQLMGGEVSVSSAEGQGSTFVARLPLGRSSARALATVGASPAAAALDAAPRLLRVLAAEDNRVNQIVLKSLLRQVGIEPVMVEDGRQALEAWTGGSWDLVLMDMHMPQVDGLTASRRIREAEAASGRPRTPILALTADAMTHQINACLAAGMDGHVAKPIEAARLFAAIEAALAADAEPEALTA